MHRYLIEVQSFQENSFLNAWSSGVDQRGCVSDISEMSSRKITTSPGKTVVNDLLTVEDVDWLTKQVLAELTQDKKAEYKEQEKQRPRGGAVKAGVIRHTSSPNQPLAYYYIRK